MWGKGKHGVLGQGTQVNHYLPVEVMTEAERPVKVFATGEYHSLAVEEADRLDMIDSGFNLLLIPNTDDLVYIPERFLSQKDLEARFRLDEQAPIERYNREGHSAKGQFSNVIGVTEEGRPILDKGLGTTEEVELKLIEPSRALSLNGDAFSSRNLVS